MNQREEGGEGEDSPGTGEGCVSHASVDANQGGRTVQERDGHICSTTERGRGGGEIRQRTIYLFICLRICIFMCVYVYNL